MIIECDNCGVQFKRKPSEVGKHNYCNNLCYKAAAKSGTWGEEKKSGKCVPCDNCNKNIYVKKHLLETYSTHFCDIKCNGEWKSKFCIGEKAFNYKNKTLSIACLTCGKVFLSSRDYSKYCSVSCRSVGQQKKVIVKCVNCQTEVIKAPSGVKNVNFCSKKCLFSFQRSSNHPSWIKDRSEVKSEIRCLRFSAQMKEWRNLVFARDNYTCQNCRERGGYIQGHHIKKFADYADLRFDVNNGITLCKKCHKDVTCQEEKFEDYFIKIIQQKSKKYIIDNIEFLTLEEFWESQLNQDFGF